MTRPAAACLATALAALCLAAGAPPAAAQGAGCATVEVQNVRPAKGHLMVAAFASAEDFGRKPLATQRLPAGEATMRFTLCGLAGSVVALTLYQDLDSDGKMARNLLGIPSEPWGSSGTAGATGPSWDGARVPLDGSTIVVKLSS